MDDGASRSLELALYPIGSVGVGCRNGIASIVMSMLAQLVSREKLRLLVTACDTGSCGVLHERAQVRGFACATHLLAD